jgi:replicative DNA helicase
MGAFSETPWPTADEAAKAVIASAILDQSAAEKVVELLTVDDFPTNFLMDDLLAQVFKAISSIVGRGKRAAPPLISEEMRRLGVIPMVDGKPYPIAQFLGDLSRSYYSGVKVEEYCQILRRYALRHRLRMMGHKLIDLSADDALETEEYTVKAEAMLSEATSLQVAQEPRRMGEVIAQRLEMHRTRKPGDLTGLKTGFIDLDVKLKGMQKGDMIIVAARPSMGKTAFAENIADCAAASGKVVLVVSLEMNAEQLADRTISAEGHVNGGMLRAATVDKDQLDQAEERLQKLMSANYFVEEHVRTVPHLRIAALRIKRKHGLDLLIIDYLQLLYGTGKYAKSGNRVQEVGEISRSLKALARELEIPVVALSQLSRAVEQRQDKRPLLSDLRETGDIEQDADIVMFLYRDDYYTKPEKPTGETEVIIAKHRNGPIGMVKLRFEQELTKFYNLEQRYGR